MPSFKEVRIHNFRGIVDGEIKLNKINVIVGENNSGKTTLLEALFLLASADQKPIGFNDAIDLLGYLHGIEKDALKRRFLFNFYISSKPVVIEGIDDNGEVRRVELTYENDNIVKKITGNGKTSLFINEQLLRRYISYTENDLWKAIVENAAIHDVIEEINVINNEEYEPLITYEPFAGKNTFYLIRKADKKKIRLKDLGDGLITFMMTKLLYDYFRPQLLLWDNIETHLEPNLLERIIAWFDDIYTETQIVVATQNLLVAKDIVSNYGKYATCLVVDVAKNGKLFVMYIDDINDLRGYIRLGLDPRALVRGKAVESVEKEQKRQEEQIV